MYRSTQKKLAMNPLTIPNPCSEDFSKMTRTERGSFCQKCSTDVYDFRQRTLPEIRQIIAGSEGKHLCGRFAKSQLDALNAEFSAWERNNLRTFQSKFTFALIAVFGLSLFSCSEETSETIIEMQNARSSLVVEPQSAIDQFGQLISNNYAGSVLKEFYPIPEMDCAYDIGVAGLIEEETVLSPVDVYGDREIMVDGGLHYTTSYAEYLRETITLDSAKSLLPEPITPPDPFATKVFPNPTQGPITLQVWVKQTAQFSLQLFNLNGQLVQDFYSGEMLEGEQRMTLDLGGFARGTYLLRILSGEQWETQKIQKL